MPPTRVLKVVGPGRAQLDIQCKRYNEKRSLADFGYVNVGDQSAAERRPPLLAAVRALGKPQVVAWLKRLEVFNKNRNPDLAKRFRLDRMYVERQR